MSFAGDNYWGHPSEDGEEFLFANDGSVPIVNENGWIFSNGETNMEVRAPNTILTQRVLTAGSLPKKWEGWRKTPRRM